MARKNRVYHWKHGWIPLTHTAALSKAKGNRKAAAKIMEKHDIAPGGGSSSAPKSAYSDMAISELVQRRNAGDRGAGEALVKGDYRKSAPTPSPRTKPVSDKPGAPGAMNKTAYDDYSAKVAARRRELQPKADAVVKTLPEPQARELAAKYDAIEKRLAIGLGEYSNRPYPSREDIETLAHASASARALRARVRDFESRRSAEAGRRPASAAQIEYIKALRAKRRRTGEEGGFMTVSGDLRTLTRAQASAYINSLKGDY